MCYLYDLFAVRPMNIVIITNYWINSKGGGIKTYLTNLVDEFKRRESIDPAVIFKYGYDTENHHIQGNKLIFSIKTFFVLSKIKPDVILSQGPWYCLFGGYMYKQIHPVKLIHTFHTEPDQKLPFLGKIFVHHLLRNCDFVTFVSKDLQNKIERIYGLSINNKVTTYAGVSSKKVSESEINEFCERFNISKNSVVLLAQGFTSNFFKAEGAKVLIRSLKKLKVSFPTIVLILTGDGLYSNVLKMYVENENMGESVVFTGNIENPYVPLEFCDIYTHISLKEGLPMALLEAMSMGKPIIATSAGGIPEAIKNGVNGILVELDPDLIAENVDYILRNKSFAIKLGLNAKKCAESIFTWELSAEKFIELIQCQGR